LRKSTIEEIEKLEQSFSGAVWVKGRNSKTLVRSGSVFFEGKLSNTGIAAILDGNPFVFDVDDEITFAWVDDLTEAGMELLFSYKTGMDYFHLIGGGID
jgi:hypothetical protein